ncbi:hypothetical protein [Moorena sp. SIO2C4]|uniref:hypothetical protein n=1 Tax=Moorena sp. SIO2C4 TaxID=2607824 RepID=UPI001375FF15|nr:hypothetical protein [Moorena sp. SIO2C4]
MPNLPKVLNAPWQRFLSNTRHLCEVALIFPAFLLALKDWQSHRLDLALDTTVNWNRYCMIHLSVVCCGRAVPFLWRVLEHNSAAVAFDTYRPKLRRSQWL